MEDRRRRDDRAPMGETRYDDRGFDPRASEDPSSRSDNGGGGVDSRPTNYPPYDDFRNGPPSRQAPDSYGRPSEPYWPGPPPLSQAFPSDPHNGRNNYNNDPLPPQHPPQQRSAPLPPPQAYFESPSSSSSSTRRQDEGDDFGDQKRFKRESFSRPADQQQPYPSEGGRLPPRRHEVYPPPRRDGSASDSRRQPSPPHRGPSYHPPPTDRGSPPKKQRLSFPDQKADFSKNAPRPPSTRSQLPAPPLSASLPPPPIFASLPARVPFSIPSNPFPNPYPFPASSSARPSPPIPAPSPTPSSSTTDRSPNPSTPVVIPVGPPRAQKNLADAPEITVEQSPNLLLSYVVSLHRPAIKKKHPAAAYEYTTLVQPTDPLVPPTVKCSITLPPESSAINKQAFGEGTKTEAKAIAARTLMLELWRCGEVDDAFAPIFDPVEEARLAAAAGVVGSTPVQIKMAEFWKDCSNDFSGKFYPVLVTFPSVLCPPPQKYADPEPAETPESKEPSRQAGDASQSIDIEETIKAVRDRDCRRDQKRRMEIEQAEEEARRKANGGVAGGEERREMWTPRPVLILTRQQMPHISTFDLFIEGERAEIKLTHFSVLNVRENDNDALKAYTIRLLRAITNRPVIMEPGKTQPAYFVAPVDRAWLEKNAEKIDRASVHDPTEVQPNALAPPASPLPSVRGMIDWDELVRSTEGPPITGWSFKDRELLEQECVDAMACGRSEFSRRYTVVALRKDLSPHSHPEDSLVSLLVFFSLGFHHRNKLIQISSPTALHLSARDQAPEHPRVHQ
jgi:hypothetical protein